MLKPIFCIGAALVDETFTCLAAPIAGTSNPAAYAKSSGGVACNLAQMLALLGHSVELICHFGADSDGQWLQNQCLKHKVGIAHALVNSVSTGKFAALLSPAGELFVAAAVSPVETEVTISYLIEKSDQLKSASMVVADGNLSASVLQWLLHFCHQADIPFVFEPVSVPKAARLASADLQGVLLITPNRDEMQMLVDHPSGMAEDQMALELLKKGVQQVWLRNGKRGSQLFSSGSMVALAAPEVEVQNTTGAGDAALAGWIYAWHQNKSQEICLQYGHALAALVLQNKESIIQNLSPELLELTFLQFYAK